MQLPCSRTEPCWLLLTPSIAPSIELLSNSRGGRKHCLQWKVHSMLSLDLPGLPKIQVGLLAYPVMSPTHSRHVSNSGGDNSTLYHHVHGEERQWCHDDVAMIGRHHRVAMTTSVYGEDDWKRRIDEEKKENSRIYVSPFKSSKPTASCRADRGHFLLNYIPATYLQTCSFWPFPP